VVNIAKKGKNKKSTWDKEPTWDQIGSAIGKKMEKKSFKYKCKEQIKFQGTGGCFYFLGFLGALVYYVTTASSFWDAVLGFIKAIFWPGFIVYGMMKFLGM
jgi:hypothetical protein